MLEEKLSLRSQDDPFGAAHKQSMAQLFFKVLTAWLTADCEIKAVWKPPKSSASGHVIKHFVKFKIDIHM